MKTVVFSTKPYDEEFLLAANNGMHELVFLETRLSVDTATLAVGAGAVCVFVNDDLGAEVLRRLSSGGVRAIALRSTGFNHVDLDQAKALGITVVRVPTYSPHAVAEHTVALLLALNRKLHRAYNRVRENNFALPGLLGFDVFGRTIGVVGTGAIGAVFANIMIGFGCDVVAVDPYPSDVCVKAGVTYVTRDELFRRSDIVSLHCPLNDTTRHIVDDASLSAMKAGVMILNTSRGALVDTVAVIDALKSGQVGYLGLDVYEEEGPLFFQDLSNTVVGDDTFSRLLTFPNVLITAHQGFFTAEALANIATTTIANLTEVAAGGHLTHEVR